MASLQFIFSKLTASLPSTRDFSVPLPSLCLGACLGLMVAASAVPVLAGSSTSRPATRTTNTTRVTGAPKATSTSRAAGAPKAAARGVEGTWICPLFAKMTPMIRVVVKKDRVVMYVPKKQPNTIQFLKQRKSASGHVEFMVVYGSARLDVMRTFYGVLRLLPYQDQSMEVALYKSTRTTAPSTWKEMPFKDLTLDGLPQRCLRADLMTRVRKASKAVQDTDLEACKVVLQKAAAPLRRRFVDEPRKCRQMMCVFGMLQAKFDQLVTCLRRRRLNPFPYLYDPANQKKIQKLFQ